MGCTQVGMNCGLPMEPKEQRDSRCMIVESRFSRFATLWRKRYIRDDMTTCLVQQKERVMPSAKA